VSLKNEGGDAAASRRLRAGVTWNCSAARGTSCCCRLPLRLPLHLFSPERLSAARRSFYAPGRDGRFVLSRLWRLRGAATHAASPRHRYLLNARASLSGIRGALRGARACSGATRLRCSALWTCRAPATSPSLLASAAGLASAPAIPAKPLVAPRRRDHLKRGVFGGLHLRRAWLSDSQTADRRDAISLPATWALEKAATTEALR